VPSSRRSGSVAFSYRGQALLAAARSVAVCRRHLRARACSETERRVACNLWRCHLSHEEKINVHPLEVLERNLSTQAEPAPQGSEQPSATGYAVFSPTGFAMVSPTGFAMVSPTGFAMVSPTGFAMASPTGFAIL